MSLGKPGKLTGLDSVGGHHSLSIPSFEIDSLYEIQSIVPEELRLVFLMIIRDSTLLGLERDQVGWRFEINGGVTRPNTPHLRHNQYISNTGSLRFMILKSDHIDL